MAKKSNQEIFLKDYKAPAYLVDAVELNFELHPSRTKVYSKISFRKILIQIPQINFFKWRKIKFSLTLKSMGIQYIQSYKRRSRM